MWDKISAVCPLSVPRTVPSFGSVTMSTAVFYSLSTDSQYLTLYRLLVLCLYVHCCLLQSVYCLSVPHTVPPVGSVSLYPQLTSTVCLLSVSTSHWTVCWFCVTMSIAVFYSLSTVCHYLTLYRLLVLCHYIHCYLLQSVHWLSVCHTVPSVGSVSLCPLLSSTVCPLSVSTPHSTVCWFCVAMSTAVFCSLSTDCQYLTLYRLLVLYPYAHFCLLQSVHCLSVPHTLPSVGSVSLYPLLFSTVCPLSVSTSHCTVCQYLTLYSLPTACRYLMLHMLTLTTLPLTLLQ
jgi:hypothetical protein